MRGLKARHIIAAMPQSLSFLLVHIVFSTKDRRPLLNESVRSGLHAYLATVVRDKKCDCFRVGGVADHVHLAVRLHSTKSLAKLVEELKISSSKWLKAQGIEMFAWQRGYRAFSVSPADAGALILYIEQQETHHRKRDFQAEMRAFLEKYHMAFDERYVWD
jgi:putative transposase